MSKRRQAEGEIHGFPQHIVVAIPFNSLRDLVLGRTKTIEIVTHTGVTVSVSTYTWGRFRKEREDLQAGFEYARSLKIRRVRNMQLISTEGKEKGDT